MLFGLIVTAMLMVMGRLPVVMSCGVMVRSRIMVMLAGRMWGSGQLLTLLKTMGRARHVCLTLTLMNRSTASRVRHICLTLTRDGPFYWWAGSSVSA